MLFSCPQCGKQYRTDDSLAGRQVTCKACGGNFSVPNQNMDTAPIPDRAADARAGYSNSTLDGDNDFLAGNHEIGSAPVVMRGGQSNDDRSRRADEIDYEICCFRFTLSRSHDSDAP
jgi:predicted Zn finger-like uncharacterized protein